MRVLINVPSEEKFNSLIAPFNSRIEVENMIAEIGRGSFNSIFRASFIGCKNVPKETLSLQIGDYCEFSENVKIIIGGEHLFNNSLVNSFSGSPQLRSQFPSIVRPTNKGLIKIGSACIFSSSVTILSGVEIGDNVLVAAGAVCSSGYLMDNSIYGGVPAKKKKSIEQPVIKWWNFAEEEIVKYYINPEYKPSNKNQCASVKISYRSFPDRNGRLQNLEMNGLFIEEDFLPLASWPANIKEYFDQIKSSNNTIEISDEVFDDLL